MTWIATEFIPKLQYSISGVDLDAVVPTSLNSLIPQTQQGLSSLGFSRNTVSTIVIHSSSGHNTIYIYQFLPLSTSTKPDKKTQVQCQLIISPQNKPSRIYTCTFTHSVNRNNAAIIRLSPAGTNNTQIQTPLPVGHPALRSVGGDLVPHFGDEP